MAWDDIELVQHQPDEHAKCTVCNQRVSNWDGCPGIPILWDAWDNWDEVVLPLLTKSQMGKAGYQTGKKLPPPAALIPRSESPDGFLRLYDPTEGVARRTMSKAQQDALKKAQYMSEQIALTCARCNREILITTRKRVLARGNVTCSICEDHDEAVEWVRGMFDTGFVIFDLETTGLGHDCEILQIGVVSCEGHVLMDTLVKPEEHDSWPGSEQFHGITPSDVVHVPYFEDVYRDLILCLRDSPVVAWNADFDSSVLWRMARRRKFDTLQNEFHCAMEWYAQWFGEWSNKHGYIWQPLGGSHNAVGDCQTILERLREMANHPSLTLPASGEGD